MLPAGESRIELLEALGRDSTIREFIEKRGEGLHHVALRVPDLGHAVRELAGSGARIAQRAAPRGRRTLYVFVHPSGTGGVLLELIQKGAANWQTS